MTRAIKKLDSHQQETLALVKAAHITLISARKIRTSEVARRVADLRFPIQQEIAKLQRELELAEATASAEVDFEIAEHEAAEDEALIAAYNAGVPIRRIALEGFGNRHDNPVYLRLRALRAEGRVGNVTNRQGEGEERESGAEFPKAINVKDLVAKSNEVQKPEYTALPDLLTLLPESEPGAGDGVSVPTVLLRMDSRDPYFVTIAENMRPGSPHRDATTATLYKHPGTGKIVAHESPEAGELLWDHPVARYVLDHPNEVRAGFDAALRSAK